MSVTDTLSSLSQEVARALLLVRQHFSSDGKLESFMRKLGWGIDNIPPPLQAVKDSADGLFEALESVTSSTPPDAAAIEALLRAISDLVQTIDDLSAAQFDPLLEADQVRQVLPRQLIDVTIIEYLEDRFPLLAHGLQFLGVIRERRVAAAGNRPPYIHQEIAWNQISVLLTNPAAVFRNTHSWGGIELDGVFILQVLQDIALALDLSAFLRALPNEQAQILEEGDEPEGAPFRLQLDVVLFDRRIAGRPVEAGIRFLPLPSVGTRAAGLGIMPYAAADFEQRFEFNPKTHFTVTSSLDLQGGIGLIIRPDEPIDIVVGTNDPANAFKSEGTFKARLEFNDPNAPSFTLIGSPTGNRIEMASASGQASVLVDEQLQPELVLEIELQKLRLVIAPGEDDGFLNNVLPSNSSAGSDLVVSLSSKRGFFFRGSASLEVLAPTHVSVGPIEFESITTVIRPTGDTVPFTVGATVVVRLGPLTAKVADIGIRADFAFPGSGGNLGPIDLDIGFKPPSGIGLSVDGGGFKGGGFLDFEPEEARYSGMLELEFQDQFALKGFGLINTRLPNGQSGFSLLIVISSEFTPIQLGLGFKLNGVGGLLGLNRTINIESLRTGIRNNTLGSILFPTDIVANADRIISDLRQVFPPMAGRFIFGPMAKITWGTPTLVTVDLGLIIEVPEPVRLAILGVLRAVLPDEDASILRVQVNFLGEINFERRQLAFDASLFDSKLLSFTLSGDMAIRLDWSADANFLLTVGGFHPAFQPPPMNLPVIRRLTLALLDGDNPRLRLEMYFAVTSNTAQFGAKLELYAAAWKFNVYGFLSFDVLFQFNPFYFIAEITAMLALRVGSSSFASIKLTLTLEGPTPWKAQGTAKFKICWFFTLKVRFNKTFGEARNTTLPDLAVLPMLAAALSADDNWEGELPAQRHRLESIRETPEIINALLIHPVGTLKVSQKVVPLNVRIDRIGSQRPSDGRVFQITEVQPVANPNVVQESFAPAQFFDMTDEEKLSSVSFKNFDSGIRVDDPERVQTGYAAAREVKYDLKYIDSQRNQRLAGSGGLLEVDVVAFNGWTLNGAIATSDLSFARNRKSSLAPEAVAVSQESFAIVNSSDLKRFDDLSVLANESEAVARLNALMEANPNLRGMLQVVPAFELAA
jgi:hypothetical protein